MKSRIHSSSVLACDAGALDRGRAHVDGSRRTALLAAACPLYVLWAAVGIGLYPLVKTGLIDLFTELKNRYREIRHDCNARRGIWRRNVVGAEALMVIIPHCRVHRRVEH